MTLALSIRRRFLSIVPTSIGRSEVIMTLFEHWNDVVCSSYDFPQRQKRLHWTAKKVTLHVKTWSFRFGINWVPNVVLICDDVKITCGSCVTACIFPSRTQRCSNVHTTSIMLERRRRNVEITLGAYWAANMINLIDISRLWRAYK